MPQVRSSSDRRVRRTRASIRQALRDLTLEVSFDAITVQDIARRADIQRNTFYDHYPDKQAILDEIIEELVRELERVTEEYFSKHQLESEQGVPPTFTLLFQAFQMDAAFYRRLFSPYGTPVFAQHIVAFLEQAGKRQEQYWFMLIPEQPVPSEIVFRFLSAAFVGVLSWWLEHECPFTAEQMGDFLWNMEVKRFIR